MSEYYAVERTGDSLAHYGVRGMKWGVRKAIASGNTAKLGKQYKKAAKKLAKLEKRGSMGKKYAKKAAIYGAGAAGAVGLGLAGTEGVAKGLRKIGSGLAKSGSKLGTAMENYNGKGSKHVKAAGKLLRGAGSGANSALGTAASSVRTWGRGTTKLPIYRFDNGLNNGYTAQMYLKNGGAAKLAALGVGAGLAAASAKNAYRAATAKKNRQKAAEFRSEMNKAFAGTRYAGPGNASAVTPYKKKKRRNSARG